MLNDGELRTAAVLVPVYRDGDGELRLVLVVRADDGGIHGGQLGLPGGKPEPADASLLATALREAQEEVGLDPDTVDVLGVLPALYLPPSGFVVHPVVGWWRDPHPVDVVDTAEVAAVARVPLAELTDAANRCRITHSSGFTGPAFEVRGMVVWGFTAGLIAGIMTLAGWELPWDTSRLRELDPEALRLAQRTWDRAPVTSHSPHALGGLA